MAGLKNSWDSTMRGLLKWGLLAFVAVSLLAIVWNPGRKGAATAESPQARQDSPPTMTAQDTRQPAKATPNDAKSKSQRKVSLKLAETKPVTLAVYYFHGYARCSTCRKLEEYSRAAVMEGFQEDTQKGRITFSTVNVEEPENEHFIQDYRLSSKSVIIQKQQGGKNLEWRDLDRIWQLVRDRDAFLTYVQGEINALKGNNP